MADGNYPVEQDGNGAVFVIHAGHFAAQQYRVPSLIFAIEVLPGMLCLGWERIGDRMVLPPCAGFTTILWLFIAPGDLIADRLGVTKDETAIS